MNILELLAIPQFGVPDKVALSYKDDEHVFLFPMPIFTLGSTTWLAV